MNDTQQTALVVIAASYFAFAFRDVQSVAYIIAVAWLLHAFVRNPQLFTTDTTLTNTPAPIRNYTEAPAVLPPQPVKASVKPVSLAPLQTSSLSSRSSSPASQTVRAYPTPSATRVVSRKPSRITFSPATGVVVRESAESTPTATATFNIASPASRVPEQPVAPTPERVSSPIQGRKHRVPEVSAGRSPVLSVRSTSPSSFAGPNGAAETVLSPAHPQEKVQVHRVETILEAETQMERVAKHLRRHGNGSRHIREHSHQSHQRRTSARSPITSYASPTSTYDYDSDSSHASTSSTRSTTSSQRSSYGLPTYEKHYTTILTLVPKRVGYLPQIQSILKAVQPYWLSLPGSVSQEVGHDSEAGTVVVVETYEGKDDVAAFEQSAEREKMLTRLSGFIDSAKTSVVRLPASSAASRYR